MFIKIITGVLVVLALFLGYVSTRDGHFNYERHGVINASAEKIFPYISNFKLGSQWSPYEKMAPEMKKTHSGNDGEVGSVMEFESNEAGSGKLEMLKVIPNELVEIRLTMLKPFFGVNLVTYRLTPEGEGTNFSWSMTGEGGFMGKLMATLIDCEKLIASDFEKGIANLKTLVEAQK